MRMALLCVIFLPLELVDYTSRDIRAASGRLQRRRSTVDVEKSVERHRRRFLLSFDCHKTRMGLPRYLATISVGTIVHRRRGVFSNGVGTATTVTGTEVRIAEAEWIRAVHLFHRVVNAGGGRYANEGVRVITAVADHFVPLPRRDETPPLLLLLLLRERIKTPSFYIHCSKGEAGEVRRLREHFARQKASSLLLWEGREEMKTVIKRRK